MSIPFAPRQETAAEAARAWRASLPRERRRSTVFRGVLIFAISAAAYLALFAGSFLLPGSALRLLSLSLAPLAIGALFVVGHDAAHHSLTPVGWLNRLLGRLALLPAWHPFTSWAHAHNTMHHGWTNFKGRHPDFVPLSKEEFDRLPRWKQWLQRVYRHPLGIGLCYTLDFYLEHLIVPRGKDYPPYRAWFHFDRLLVLAFMGVQVASGWWLSAWPPELLLPRWGLVLLAVLVPWWVWMSFQGVASYIQHTHPRTAWYDNEDEWSFYHVQLRSTTHVVFPWPIERLLNNIMDHPAHHIDPTIPLYELPASQKMLEQRAPQHSVVVYYWTPWEYLRTCRTCKLYDYRRHCWLDFAGNPTTAEGLNGQRAPGGATEAEGSPRTSSQVRAP
jgi:omega-6 fatty acid desaturase (delta-12 desaturase)